jgi:hypothetical protein
VKTGHSPAEFSTKSCGLEGAIFPLMMVVVVVVVVAMVMCIYMYTLCSLCK